MEYVSAFYNLDFKENINPTEIKVDTSCAFHCT
jgi:hypothetical protein